MAKRKLNRQQKWRIEKIQQEKARRAQKKEKDIDRQLEGGELSHEQTGLVISHFGTQIEVEALEGDHAGEIFRCHFRATLQNIVTGDRVIWRASPDASGVIESILPRHSLLQRPDSYGKLKAVAANIDDLIIVASPLPMTYSMLLDRYLVAAENLDIEPVILMNKADLIDSGNQQAIDDLLAPYQALGYRTLFASATEQHGLDDLQAFLNHKNTVFVGQSGVGKSSLIKALLPLQDIRIGEISTANKKGRHTTTTARLFHLPTGGNLIDSPGIREFGLWHMTEQELIHGFRELRALEGHCKFRNCAHQAEPGCAIRQSLQEGNIHADRFENFQKLKTTLDDLDVWQQD